MNVFYALLLFCFALSRAPKLFFDARFKRKKIPTFSQRLGRNLSVVDTKRPLIWIHAVSVGEVKAIRSLLRALRLQKPDHVFFLTTTTITGQEEARRSLPELDAQAILPLDFASIMHRWVNILRPELFLLVESDFWRNLLRALQRSGCHICLINGKLSERSYRRFAWFPRFAQELFSMFPLLGVQNQEYARRFTSFLKDPSRLVVTGNLKLDPLLTQVDVLYWRKQLNLHSHSLVLSIVSTHAPEEEELLRRIAPLWEQFPFLLIFIAPRHPERAAALKPLLKSYSPFVQWSHPTPRTQADRILLIDEMGHLPICYALSQWVIVGGSFREGIGGHNVLEPSFYGAYTLYGPHHWAQRELVATLQAHAAGEEVSLHSLQGRMQQLLAHPSARHTVTLSLEESPSRKTLSEILRSQERFSGHKI